MAKPFPAGDRYLSGGFQPIRMECDCDDLVVEGVIPEELSGTLYRVGPNPQFAPRGPYNPLLADGMIHAFRVANGRVSYRNRWVRTQQWKLERAAGQSLFGTMGAGRGAAAEVAGMSTDGVANTNLIWHAGRLLVLEEGHAPIEVDPLTLETLGVWTFEGALPANMAAHPKIDPRTGEMLAFANFPRRDFSGILAFYVIDPRGKLVRCEWIDTPFPALVHDFAITAEYVLFIICPLTISAERMSRGAPPIAWEPKNPTQVGLLPRNGSPSEVRWYTGEACMVWHTLNAFVDADSICLDVCQQAAPAFTLADGSAAGAAHDLRQHLTRWTLREQAGSRISMHRLSDTVCEYPRLNERWTGRPYRYGYVACAGGPGTGDLFHRGLGRFDHDSAIMSIYHAEPQCAVSEPVFAAKSEGSSEEDGYLLATVFDESRNASHLAVFDARQIEAGPIARAHLDHRVPMGFHGLWRSSAVGCGG